MSEVVNKLEQGILGSVMHDGTGKVADFFIDEGITEAWFTENETLRLWNSISVLRQASKAVSDMDVMLEASKTHGFRPNSINDCMDSVNGWGGWKMLLERFREAYRLRVLQRATLFLQDGIKEGGNTDEVLSEFNTQIGMMDQSERSMIPSSAFIPESMKKLREGGKEALGIPTGFVDLDKFIHGLRKQTVTVIAARPGRGKTSLALNILDHFAVALKEPSALFSMEMAQDEIGQRLVCARAEVSKSRIIDNTMTNYQAENVFAAEKALANAPLWIFDRKSQTMSSIAAKCRRLKNQRGLSLVVIDHLSLVTPARGSGENRREQVDGISRDIKCLSGDIDCAVVVLVQLNRESEKANRKPRMSDMREAGGIEQDADNILTLYDDNEENVTGLDILKQRDGSTGSIKLTFKKFWTKFFNYEGVAK